MSRRLFVLAPLVLAAATAQAQVRPPKPPAPAAPPRPPAAVIAPGDLANLAGLADLDLDVDFDLRTNFDLPRSFALDLKPMIAGATADALAGLADFDAWQAGPPARAWTVARDGESADYSRGTSALDDGKYEQAVEAFNKVIAANGKRADGAMYWKSYALNRLGRGAEALATLDEMLKKYSSSRWANDARALQVEVRQASGRPVNPAQQGDEELKLIALNGIVSRDPERGVPMVEQILAGTASPRMKERALFVLAQSGSPRAKTILTDVAKGKGNPDLQMKALDYLGVFGDGPDVPLLVEIYKATPDVDVKKRVIRSLSSTGRRGFGFGFSFGPEIAVARAFASSGAMEKLAESSAEMKEEMQRAQADMQRAQADMERARTQSERDSERARAQAERNTARAARTTGAVAGAVVSERAKVREAKAKEASDALWQLYQVEPAQELKREILRSMYFGDQLDRLVQVARTEKDADLRRAALQAMTFSKSPKAGETLVGLYRDEKDPSVKRQIIDVLGAQSTAGPLVQVARLETDLQFRKTIVQRLSFMKDKEATDYMVELLKK
jgi:tetratricopeptide (TPR) repeat protein